MKVNVYVPGASARGLWVTGSVIPIFFPALVAGVCLTGSVIAIFALAALLP
jgi:hypothetical protein